MIEELLNGGYIFEEEAMELAECGEEEVIRTYDRHIYGSEPERFIQDSLIERFLEMTMDGFAIYGTDTERELDGVRSVNSFEEAGLLTSDKGIVLELTSGKQVQLTINVRKGW